MSARGKYRPTLLKLAARHCPGAINHYVEGRDYDRRIFQTGTAAHLMIQRCAEATAKAGHMLGREEVEAVSLQVGKRLISHGRKFDGVPERGFSPDAVWAGRELALRYLEECPIPASTEDADLEDLQAEIGLAVDEDWLPHPYSTEARLRLVIDQEALRVEVDEESATRILHVTDYKSAWHTNADELDTVQMRAQAVVALIHYRRKFPDVDIDVVRQEVINLRTRKSCTRDMWLADDGMDTLERWRDEIGATMDALDESRGEDGRLPFVPGPGCIDCLWVSSCEAAREMADGNPAADIVDAETLARRFAVLDALRAETIKRLKQQLGEIGHLEVDGKSIGFVEGVERKPIDEPALAVWAEWSKRVEDLEGFLTHLPLGVTQLVAAAKALHPAKDERDEREALVDLWTIETPKVTFGIHKGKVEP